MTSTSLETILDVHEQFAHLLDSVTGEKAQVTTADQNIGTRIPLR